MTKEDKELLFKDLSSRLPYHVRVKIWLKDGTTEEGVLDLEHNYADVLRDAFYYNKIIEIKPYLRSMLNMTLEEEREYGLLCFDVSYHDKDTPKYSFKLIKWLLKKHFDFIGLIPKGLAIEITEENNPYKK